MNTPPLSSSGSATALHLLVALDQQLLLEADERLVADAGLFGERDLERHRRGDLAAEIELHQRLHEVVGAVGEFQAGAQHVELLLLGHGGERFELRRNGLQADDLQPARLADLGDLHVEDAGALLHLGALAVRDREDHGDDPRLEQRGEIDRHAGAADDRFDGVVLGVGQQGVEAAAVGEHDQRGRLGDHRRGGVLRQVGNLERNDLRLVESRLDGGRRLVTRSSVR